MLRHSDEYLASQSLHHILVLRIVADAVYDFFYLLKESGYRRYTRFQLRQVVDTNTFVITNTLFLAPTSIDVDANPFVITNTFVFGANKFLTSKY